MSSLTSVLYKVQVLELTQGQHVEKEILTVLVQQMQEGRQKAGVDGQDTSTQPAGVDQFVVDML